MLSVVFAGVRSIELQHNGLEQLPLPAKGNCVSPAAKKDSSPDRHRVQSLWLRWFPKSTRGRIVFVAIVAASVVFGARQIWRGVQSHVEAESEYQVAPGDIEISGLPAWIKADVKAEVIRDAGLPERISILDDRVPERLSQAFSLHPWVAKVEKVECTYPAHIRVKLVYRRPVAMMEVRGGLLPVDSDAVLLPTNDFSSREAEGYLRVSGAASSPAGPVGTPWGDSAVQAAAKLAALLDPIKEKLQLRRVRIHFAQNASDDLPHAELAIITRAGNAFVWGSGPGDEALEEAKQDEKLSRLEKLAADRGSLDAVPEKERDLRRVPAAAPLAETSREEKKQ